MKKSIALTMAALMSVSTSVTVFADNTANQELESTLAIAHLIAIEIVPTHLVNHDAHNKLWALNICCVCLLRIHRAASHECHSDKACNLNLFHFLCLYLIIYFPNSCFMCMQRYLMHVSMLLQMR